MGILKGPVVLFEFREDIMLQIYSLVAGEVKKGI